MLRPFYRQATTSEGTGMEVSNLMKWIDDE